MTNKFIVVLIPVVFLLSCASGIRLQFEQPGQISLAGIKRLAVAPTTGLREATLLENRLVEELKKMNYFVLFDKNDLSDSLMQHQLSFQQIANISDSLSLVEIGGILNLDGMLFTDLKTLEMDFEAQGEEKVEKVVWTGEYERNELGEIIEEETPTGEKVKKKKLKVKILDQQFQLRKATAEAFFRLVDFQMGTTIGSWHLIENYVDNTLIGDDSQKLPDEKEIKHILINHLVDDFIQEVAPRTVRVKRPIEIGIAELDSGAVFARKGQWDQALQIWKEAEQKYPNNAKVYYDIGLAYEAIGDYKFAEINYLKALLLDIDNKIYQQAINNIKEIWSEKGKTK